MQENLPCVIKTVKHLKEIGAYKIVSPPEGQTKKYREENPSAIGFFCAL